MEFENICFIISPIGLPESEARKEADNVLDFIIEPSLASFALKAVRSDQISQPGVITNQMYEYILKSKLCMVVLTGENPNVFYELAVAQCAGKPTVLLIEENKKLPFDIKDLRIIQYNLNDPRRVRNEVDINQVKSQINDIKENNWQMPSLLNQYSYGPKVFTEDEILRKAESLKPVPLNYSIGKSFIISNEPNSLLKVITGSIEYVSNIDIVVNSENVDLQLARFYDASLSGTLRYLDAEKSGGGNVIRDNLNEQIQSEIARIGPVPVNPGTVAITKTSGLAEQGIKFVFHLALARGEVGSGYHTVSERLEAGIRNVFKAFTEKSKADDSIKSILFPLLGAGTGKADPTEGALNLIRIILDEVRKLPMPVTIFLLAWKESHSIAFQEAAIKLNLKAAE